MQSPEYPELLFVTPAAYGSGRDGRKVMYSVIHYTAGSERSTSAEDGAAYDARRSDGTSCHFFHDQDSTVQCVRTTDRSNSAFSKGNRLGIHHELCGSQQSRAQWLDAASLGTLRQAARWVAEDCRRYGLPPRRLSVAETRAAWYTANSAGPRGIVGHVDITRAYPEDGGDHEDPGTEFPWDIFLPMVQAHLDGTTEGDDMSWNELLPDFTGRQAQPGKAADLMWATAHAAEDGLGAVRALEAKLTTLAAADQARDAATLAAVNALASVVQAGGGDVDVVAIVAAIDAAAKRVHDDIKARFVAGGAVV